MASTGAEDQPPKTKFHLSICNKGAQSRPKLIVVLKLPTPQKQGQTSPFFTKLPPEIRQMIYEYALPPKFDDRQDQGNPFPLLDVCRTIRNESIKLYGQYVKDEIARCNGEYTEAIRRSKKGDSIQNVLCCVGYVTSEARQWEGRVITMTEELDRLRRLGYTDGTELLPDDPRAVRTAPGANGLA